MPTTIRIGAGDRPAILNGALGPASPKPQRFRLLKPKLIRMIAAAARATPIRSILHLGAALIRLEPEAQQENNGRDRDQDAEGRAPADRGAENAADHECQNAGAGARRTQRAQRRRLLLALVVLGDERHQRRHDHGAGRAAQRLGRDHQIGGRAEGHQHLRAAEHDHRGAEDCSAPKRWVSLAPSMTKPATSIE